MTQALILDGDTLDDAPYIVGTEDNRVIMGLGDKIYAKGATKDSDTRNWSIFRKGKALLDPDTEETLGHETEYVGDARTVQADDVMTLEITRSVQEARRDDRLMPSTANSDVTVCAACTGEIDQRQHHFGLWSAYRSDKISNRGYQQGQQGRS